MNGKIWVLWNLKSVKLTNIAEHEQALHCEILGVITGKCQNLIAIYGQNSHEQRKDMWRFLIQETSHIQTPLLVGGDFNAVLAAEDRFQGNTITEANIVDFQQCVFGY